MTFKWGKAKQNVETEVKQIQTWNAMKTFQQQQVNNLPA